MHRPLKRPTNVTNNEAVSEEPQKETRTSMGSVGSVDGDGWRTRCGFDKVIERHDASRTRCYMDEISDNKTILKLD